MAATDALVTVVLLCTLLAVGGMRTCPNGSLWLGEDIHHCYWPSPQPMTWNDAEAYCQSIDSYAHLASVDDDFLEWLLRDAATKAYDESFYWLGGFKNESGDWCWSDDTYQCTMYYTHWAKGTLQP